MKTNDKKSVEIKKGRRYYIVQKIYSYSIFPEIFRGKVTRIGKTNREWYYDKIHTIVDGITDTGIETFCLSSQCTATKIYSHKQEAINYFNGKVEQIQRTKQIKMKREFKESQEQVNNLKGR